MAAQQPEVLISEVAPRDGLQSIQSIMTTAQKCKWIDALVQADLKEIEVGSFVSEKLLPQMA
ncbi:MAG: hydroxymethylglutaryl-CoA lyase, partial [Betaproteobacteria bacterium]